MPPWKGCRPTQQAVLYAFLGARLETRPRKGLSLQECETWFNTAWGAGLSGVTTDEIMAMTRGEK